jgi:hypothetical protein
MLDTPGANLIKLFGVNLLTLFCKLDIFIKIVINIAYVWSSLQKSVSKFTLK